MMSMKRALMALCFFSLLLPRIIAAEDIAYVDKEIIRNGDFNTYLYTAWHEYWCDITSLAGKDDTYGLRLEHLGVSDDRYTFQKLAIPSRIDSATIRFEYRALEDVGNDNLPVALEVSIAKSNGFDSVNLTQRSPLTPVGVIHSEIIRSAFDWKKFTADLAPSLVEAMQAAHNEGEFVFLLFSQAKADGNDEHGFITDIDNLSLKVDGTQTVPEMHGSIAYLEETEDGDPSAVSILNPNDNSVDTIWTHPDGKFDDWSNVAWHPDATELAFVSDHDFAFYIFKANIFSIKPDGSGIHRIPATPTQVEIQDGDYPKVTVTGSIRADTGTLGERYTIVMGIQGTDKGVVLVATDGETVPFTITDVPVLDDPDIFNQPLIMQYHSTNCSGGIEYAFPIAAVANGRVDVGTMGFFGSNCIGILTGSYPTDLAWKHDGSELGFSMLGLMKVDAAATNEFAISEIAPDGSGFSSNMAWSPVDNRFLYLDFSFITANEELFIAEEGGESRRLLDDIESVTPVWLPDGSGFLYVGWPEDEMVSFDDNIYHYDLASGQSRRLTYFREELIDYMSISPDGRHIVFQLLDHRSDPRNSNLWIMDRLNPVEIWPITDSGNCRNPDWSRKDVISVNGPDDNQDPADGPVDTGGNAGGNQGGGGGGGGCFISSSRPTI